MNGYVMALIVIGICNLIVASAVLALLWVRRGYTLETAVILAKIEALRVQLGVMDVKNDSHHRGVSGWLHMLMERFGFLKAQHPMPHKFRDPS